MKFAGLVSRMGLVSIIAASVALADAPATRPAQSFPESEIIRKALREVAGARANKTQPYTPQEWSQMLQFLSDYSPARYYVLQHTQMAPNNPIRLDLIRKWRNYNFVRENFPAVAEVHLKRIKTEDDLFALVVQARSAPASSEPEYREKIRGKVANLVQLGFDEQNLRIAKLQQLLEEEKSKLSAAEENQDKIIDHRTDAIMNRIHPTHDATTKPTTQPTVQLAPDGGISMDDAHLSPQALANELPG